MDKLTLTLLFRLRLCQSPFSDNFTRWRQNRDVPVNAHFLQKERKQWATLWHVIWFWWAVQVHEMLAIIIILTVSNFKKQPFFGHLILRLLSLVTWACCCLNSLELCYVHKMVGFSISWHGVHLEVKSLTLSTAAAVTVNDAQLWVPFWYFKDTQAGSRQMMKTNKKIQGTDW